MKITGNSIWVSYFIKSDQQLINTSFNEYCKFLKISIKFLISFGKFYLSHLQIARGKKKKKIVSGFPQIEYW